MGDVGYAVGASVGVDGAEEGSTLGVHVSIGA